MTEEGMIVEGVLYGSPELYLVSVDYMDKTLILEISGGFVFV